MPATYEPIATTTLGSATNTVDFLSVPQTYTDLVAVVVGQNSAGNNPIYINFNGGNVSGWGRTLITGNGTAATSSNLTAQTGGISLQQLSSTYPTLHQINIFSYTGSTYKTILSRQSYDNNGSGNTTAIVAMAPITAAITQVNFFCTTGNFTAGSTFTLYGIKAA